MNEINSAERKTFFENFTATNVNGLWHITGSEGFSVQLVDGATEEDAMRIVMSLNSAPAMRKALLRINHSEVQSLSNGCATEVGVALLRCGLDRRAEITISGVNAV